MQQAAAKRYGKEVLRYFSSQVRRLWGSVRAREAYVCEGLCGNVFRCLISALRVCIIDCGEDLAHLVAKINVLNAVARVDEGTGIAGRVCLGSTDRDSIALSRSKGACTN